VPFSELVTSVPDAGLLGETSFSALGRERAFDDERGVRWTRRGNDALHGKALGKRLVDERVLVWHEYGPDVTVVPAAERGEFWRRAQDRARESVHAEFRGHEFRDATGQVLLVVHEDC
jgi:hypothetical protein